MLKKLSSYTFALLGLIVLFNSCKKEYESIQNTDDAKIQAYISENNLTFTKDSSGFYSQIVSQGTGDLYKNTDSTLYNISVKSLATGTIYYASSSEGNLGTFVGYANALRYGPGQFDVVNLPSINKALLALKPGGAVRIISPSYLAFGKNGVSSSAINVPSNEVIDITITTLPEKKQSDVDDRLIQSFVAQNSDLNLTKGPAGIYSSISGPDTGTVVINRGTTINAKYTVKFLDGTVVDSSTDGTYSSVVNGVISAWQIMLPGLKAGKKIRMVVPSATAYGTAGSSTGVPAIPPNAVLDFDIEITSAVN